MNQFTRLRLDLEQVLRNPNSHTSQFIIDRLTLGNTWANLPPNPRGAIYN